MRNKQNGRFSKDFRVRFLKGFSAVVLILWIVVGIQSGWNWFDSRVRSALTYTITIEKANAQEFIGPIDWKNQVREIWKDYGMDVDIMNKIVFLESSWNPKAVGDHGWSLGLYQIYTKVHNIDRECATDPICSTYEAVRIWEKQGYYAWSAYRLID